MPSSYSFQLLYTCIFRVFSTALQPRSAREIPSVMNRDSNPLPLMLQLHNQFAEAASGTDAQRSVSIAPLSPPCHLFPPGKALSDCTMNQVGELILLKTNIAKNPLFGFNRKVNACADTRGNQNSDNLIWFKLIVKLQHCIPGFEKG